MLPAPPKLPSATNHYVGGAVAVLLCLGLAILNVHIGRYWLAGFMGALSAANLYTGTQFFISRRRLKEAIAMLYAIQHPEAH